MKKPLLLWLFIAFLITGVHAQSYEYNQVKGFHMRSSGSIIKDDAIMGYYILYPVEKADKKNITYKISLLDNDLNQSAEFDLVRPKTYIMIESSFNNDAFVFSLFDVKKKIIEYVSFDRSGKELGSVKTEKLKLYQLALINEILTNPEISNPTIFPSGDDAFVRLGIVKNSKTGYTITKYDNRLKQIWEFGSDKNSDMVEVADVLSANENFVLVRVNKTKSATAQKFETYLVLLDAKTGKPHYNFKTLDDSEGQLSVLNGFVVDDSGDVLLVGEFYAPNDNPIKDKSLGMYMRLVEKNGEYGFYKKYNWDGEIARVKKESDNIESKKNTDNDLIYFHHFVKSSNGHVFAVAEQYRKQASALGIASAALGGGRGSAAMFEIRVTDLVVAEFDSDMNMINYSIVPKKLTRVLLPQGAGLMSPQRLGHYVKAIGGFDYNFTSKNNEMDSYHSVYTDYDRKDAESGKKADKMIGTVNIVGGEINTERVAMNTDANLLWIRPAKPGYILVGEYFRKGKRVKLRLEKITA